MPFIGVGIAFIALGLGGGRRGAFLGIGVTFIAVGVALSTRRGGR